jgi:hypothetical protein
MKNKIMYYIKIIIGCILTLILWISMLGMYEIEGTDMDGEHILTIPSITEIFGGRRD